MSQCLYCGQKCKAHLFILDLYLSLTSCAPTMQLHHLALSRRGWSMRSTVRGGPWFWPCAGPTHTHTCYRRSPLQSLSWRWTREGFQMQWITQLTPTLCVSWAEFFLSVSPQELYGSLSNDSRMLRALKDLLPDVEKIVKLQYVSLTC